MAKEKTGFLKGAYDLHGPDDNSRHYDNWANSYDEMMTEYHYVAPHGARFAGALCVFDGKGFRLRLRHRIGGRTIKILGFYRHGRH